MAGTYQTTINNKKSIDGNGNGNGNDESDDDDNGNKGDGRWKSGSSA